MSKYHVLLTRPLAPKAMQMLEETVELTTIAPNKVNKDSLLENLKGKNALICHLNDEIDAEILEANPALRIVANVAVGYNNIDVKTATRLGIPVTNTPGVLTETSADLAFALLMATARKLIEADQFLRSGRFEGWGMLDFLGTDIHGATLGIIGMGRIGQAVARRALGFDMQVLYWNRTRLSAETEKELKVVFVEKEALLNQSDFVSLHVAYTPQTHHLIDSKALARMKPGAFLINTARGAVVDEAALVHALKTGQIAGAGLDVFEEEPRVHPELLPMKNVVLLPHIGSASLATRTKMGIMAVRDCLAALGGVQPANVVKANG